MNILAPQKALLVSVFLLICNALSAQGWQQQLAAAYPHSLHAAEDGRFWLFYTDEFELIGKKFEAGGTCVETVALGPAGTDVWPVAGGGFVSARLQSGEWVGPSALLIEKRDAGGQPVWQKTFSDTVLLNGVALTPTHDGGFWLGSLPQAVASTQPLWSVTKELRLRRLDATGTVLAEVHFPEDLSFLFLVSLRQLVVLPDNGLVVMLNVSVTGTDRSYRLWHFGPNGNFLGDITVDQESSYTSGCSINLDEESNLLLASDWATADNRHHAVWRALPVNGAELFHETVEAKPVAGNQFHQPAPLAMARLGCGDYLTLLHLTNFTLESWNVDGERQWQRPIPGPMDAGYFTPAFPPARYGRYLLPTADGGALVTVPDGDGARLLKITCNGLTSNDGALARGRVVHDDDYECDADATEVGPGVSLPVSLERDGDGPTIVWTDATTGRFDVPLDPGAWAVQPWAANGLDPWPEVSPICDVAQALLVFPGTGSVEVTIPLAATTSTAPEPQAPALWTLYPNPAAERFVLQQQETITGPVRVTVWSAQGQAVYRQEWRTSEAMEVGVQDWTPGVYRVQVEQAGQRAEFVLVKI